MLLNTKQFHNSNNSVQVNSQIFIIYNITSLVNQENDLGHCLHSKCQITAIFTCIDMSTDGDYVALNPSNVRYFTFNEQLKYQNKQFKNFSNK